MVYRSNAPNLIIMGIDKNSLYKALRGVFAIINAIIAIIRRIPPDASNLKKKKKLSNNCCHNNSESLTLNNMPNHGS